MQTKAVVGLIRYWLTANDPKRTFRPATSDPVLPPGKGPLSASSKLSKSPRRGSKNRLHGLYLCEKQHRGLYHLSAAAGI